MCLFWSLDSGCCLVCNVSSWWTHWLCLGLRPRCRDGLSSQQQQNVPSASEEAAGRRPGSLTCGRQPWHGVSWPTGQEGSAASVLVEGV